ncbi:uncharacterized protein PAN0_005c2719 [Moesziomyces antarcticus]|uniref:Uncharacterized protein n=1 Tax=Pseudozyma antarctica TaxID=84753 RepID=A0A081CCV9_PSEA2|nr:uncharacterized protein PAN0_005c2719 [Moesziomyces antarcticus]GAK64505.1 hypothetical protein PAN0_005c2719 [Moesziomyces antarcticus]
MHRNHLPRRSRPNSLVDAVAAGRARLDRDGAQPTALTRIIGAPVCKSHPALHHPPLSLSTLTSTSSSTSARLIHSIFITHALPRVADLVRKPIPPPPLSSPSASAFSRFCIQHLCRLAHHPSPLVSTTAVANVSCYLPCTLARSQQASASATSASSRYNSQVYTTAPLALGSEIGFVHRPAHSSTRRDLRVLACFTQEAHNHASSGQTATAANILADIPIVSKHLGHRPLQSDPIQSNPSMH